MKKDLKSLIILFKAYHSLERSVKYSLVDTNLNVNEFAVMEALYVKEALTTQQLIDAILIPNSSMTYVLEILSEKNYITKEKKAEDKRVQILKLTDLGRDVFEEIYEDHFDYMRSIFDVLNADEEAMLQTTVKKVGKKAEEMI